MPIIEVPGYGKIQFPDEMSREEIVAAIRRLPPPETATQTSQEQPEEIDLGRRIAGMTGAMVGTGISGARALGKGVLSGAGSLEEEREMARIRGRRKMGIPDVTPPAAPPAAPTSLGSGAANWTRAMGSVPNVIAQQALTMDKEHPLGGQNLINKDVKNLQKIAEIGEGSKQLVTLPSGMQIMVSREEAERILAEMAKAEEAAKVPKSGLDRVSELFARMMQSAPAQGIAKAGRYVVPPLAVGSSAMDLYDVMAEQEKSPEEIDRLKQALAAISGVSGLAALYPPLTLPMGAVSLGATGLQALRERLNQPPSNP